MAKPEPMVHGLRMTNEAICRDAIDGTENPRHLLVPLGSLRPALIAMIRAEHPSLSDSDLIATRTANRYRSVYIEQLLRHERGAFTDLDAEIVKSIANQETLAGNIEDDFAGDRTIGDRAADTLASFGGSWAFLVSFAAFLAAWMMWNQSRGPGAFDPFPFILLNLILSTIAAIQAPVIMMSQRRQESRDRMRARSDYQVNLKAELEIRLLHEKIDHLIAREWQRLEEARAVQLEILDGSKDSDG
jgi:uncharacterized membrane protein